MLLQEEEYEGESAEGGSGRAPAGALFALDDADVHVCRRFASLLPRSRTLALVLIAVATFVARHTAMTASRHHVAIAAERGSRKHSVSSEASKGAAAAAVEAVEAVAATAASGSRADGTEGVPRTDLDVTAAPKTAAASSSSSDDDALPTLGLVARSDGYAPLSRHTLAAYGHEHIVEPYRTTVLEATIDGAVPATALTDAAFRWRVERVPGGAPTNYTGRTVELVFTEPRAHYRVRLELSTTTHDERVLSTTHTARAICKYVRREIRSMLDSDRIAYLEALEIMYNTSEAVGQARYGSRYRSADSFTALHSSSDYCFHNNLVFLTSHPAFALALDQSLQSIDPRISQPYWDFMIDHSLGHDWAHAPIYKPDWFGSVDNDADDGYRIRGRFRNVSTLYDPTGELYPKATHNPYGYVSNPRSMNPSATIQRTNKFCGLENTQGFPSCSRLKDCFGNFTTLYDFDLCVENNVHANLHGLHGGLWECPIDLKHELDAMKPWATQEMLSFLFANIAEEVMTKSETLFPHYDCPTACNFTAAASDDGSAASVPPPMLDAAAAANDDERLRRSGRRRPLGALVKDDDHWGDGAGGGADGGAVEPGMATAAAGGAAGTEGEEFAACHCVSTINDTATLSDHETFKYIADAIAKVASGYEGPRFLESDPYKGYSPADWHSTWLYFKDLTFEQTNTLYRLYFNVLSQPGLYGPFATGSAPNDPIFWPMHPVFDKAWQALRLSQPYNGYNLTWHNPNTTGCEMGMGWKDTLPFSHLFSDDFFTQGTGGVNASDYTNEQLWDYFDPAGDAIPYVYDQFESWGDCDWDPIFGGDGTLFYH